MLNAFTDHRCTYVEVTKSEHGHGGSGWEFGTCLWSPARNKAGHDLYRLMRDAEENDLVLHVIHDHWGPGETEHRIIGRSFVAGSVEERVDEPPSPGDWAGQSPYYRLPLRDYEAFDEPVSIGAFVELYDQEIREDLAHRPSRYPFILYDHGRRIQLRQGGYINECSPALFDLIKLSIGEGTVPPSAPASPQNAKPASADREYKETKRLAGERFAFARNPGLVRDARAIRGYECEACDFDFEATYGDLGKEYIECHHVDPLSNRDHPITSTTVRDVRMLCANCHRMVHRTRPASLVEDLREALDLPPRPQIPGL